MKCSKLLFLFVGLLLLLACGREKANTKKAEARDSLAIDSLRLHEKAERTRDALAPSWFVKPPAGENAIFAVGKGISGASTIARKKAILKAQVALAEQLQKEKSGTEPDSLSLLVNQSYVVREYRLKRDKHWQYYVLMKMPKH